MRWIVINFTYKIIKKRKEKKIAIYGISDVMGSYSLPKWTNSAC